MEILVNLIDAISKLTWGFNPIKYSLSSQYREEFHKRSGMSLTMTVVGFVTGVLIAISVLAGIVLLIKYRT